METRKDKAKMEKSTLYPSCALQDCIEFIKLIDTLGGKGADEGTILASLKLKSPSTSSYWRKSSSAKQFGLVNKKGSYWEIADIGRRILYPTGGETEKQKLRLQAFLSPKLYAQLKERYDGKQLPTQETFANVLINEYGISKVAKDRAAEVFFDSAKYAGVLSEDNFFRVSEEVKPSQDKTAVETIEGDQALPGGVTGTQSVKVTLSGGTTGTIIVPNTITKKDVERLKKMLDLLVVEEGAEAS